MPRSSLLIPEHQWRRMGRGWRTVRAAYRNARVLWREFRRPILVFVVAAFGGGWLYGELWTAAGYERIPYVDLPYTMMALMIVEPPTDLPHEVQLIVFWYLMPVIAAYVAGRGILDFVNLFFNPTERQNAWEEAVASTYRNHVIVLGVGHLGLRVIRALAKMGFDTVAIDYQITPARAEELRKLRVPLVNSDGRLASTLEQAALPAAQALIVCTSNDHMNLEVTMRARDLNPDIRIVVRMWEDDFAQQIRRFMNVEAVLSTTNIAAPSFAAYALGIEITQTLTVDGVDYSMIQLTVTPGSFLDGPTIGELQEKHDMDIVLHGDDGALVVHPAASTQVRAGDTLVIFAQHQNITGIVARNQRQRMRTVE
jgi:voltage-gated potassium channel